MLAHEGDDEFGGFLQASSRLVPVRPESDPDRCATDDTGPPRPRPAARVAAGEGGCARSCGSAAGQCLCAGSGAGAVRARTGALTSTVCLFPALSSNVSVTGTVSPSFNGCFSSISITW